MGRRPQLRLVKVRASGSALESGRPQPQDRRGARVGCGCDGGHRGGLCTHRSLSLDLWSRRGGGGEDSSEKKTSLWRSCGAVGGGGGPPTRATSSVRRIALGSGSETWFHLPPSHADPADPSTLSAAPPLRTPPPWFLGAPSCPFPCSLSCESGEINVPRVSLPLINIAVSGEETVHPAAVTVAARRRPAGALRSLPEPLHSGSLRRAAGGSCFSRSGPGDAIPAPGV